MKPNTENQKLVLEAIRTIVAREGRGALLREIAAELGRPIPTIVHQAQALVRMGLVYRHGRGLHLNLQDKNLLLGWRDAIAALEKAIFPLLVEHHAQPALVEAITGAFADAKNATEEKCGNAPENTSEAN